MNAKEINQDCPGETNGPPPANRGGRTIQPLLFLEFGGSERLHLTPDHLEVDFMLWVSGSQSVVLRPVACWQFVRTVNLWALP